MTFFVIPIQFYSDLIEFKQFSLDSRFPFTWFFFSGNWFQPAKSMTESVAVPGRGSQAATKALDYITLEADRAIWFGGKQVSQVLPPVLSSISLSEYLLGEKVLTIAGKLGEADSLTRLSPLNHSLSSLLWGHKYVAEIPPPEWEKRVG